MSDRENVIRNLEICASGCCEGCTYHKPDALNLCCWDRLMMDAAKLLKEQVSKEPFTIHKDTVDEVYDYIAECPKCGMTWAMWHSEKMRYCPGCGQAVKWE